jgi:HK97 gp10 family phage protein
MARKSSVQHRKLSRLLRRAPDDVRLPVKEALADATQIVFSAAKQNAPVDEGDLRDQLQARLSRSGLSSQIGYLTKTARKKAFHAPFVHEGTKGAPEKKIPPMQRNPYMTNALEANKERVIKEIDTAVDAALDKLSIG